MVQTAPVSRGLAPWMGHAKDHHKFGSNCLCAWYAGVRVTVKDYSLTVLKTVVCGAVYENMHYKNILGSIVRAQNCIPVQDFYLVIHGI